jgi:hypothetical protein
MAIDREKSKDLSRRHVVYHKSHMNYYRNEHGCTSNEKPATVMYCKSEAMLGIKRYIF